MWFLKLHYNVKGGCNFYKTNFQKFVTTCKSALKYNMLWSNFATWNDQPRIVMQKVGDALKENIIKNN